MVRPRDGAGPNALIALDGRDGIERWRVALADPERLTPSPVMFSPDGRELALLVRAVAAGPDGTDVGRLLVFAAGDGHEQRRIQLPNDATLVGPSVSTAASWGYDGDVFWVQHLRPAHDSDHAMNLEPGHVVATTCAYEVYDARQSHARPLRTSADQSGELGAALRDCQILAVRPLAGSAVAVVGLSRDGGLTITFLDAPP